VARREPTPDAAARLFSRRGWRATGLVGLAKKVGLTHSGVLHHFGTKQNLLLAAVVARRDQQQRTLMTDMSQHIGIHAIGRVLPMTAADQQAKPTSPACSPYSSPRASTPTSPCTTTSATGTPECAATSPLRSAQPQADGHIRADIDPDLAAAQIAAFIVSLQTLGLLDPHNIDKPATYQQQTKTLLDGLPHHSPDRTAPRQPGSVSPRRRRLRPQAEPIAAHDRRAGTVGADLMADRPVRLVR